MKRQTRIGLAVALTGLLCAGLVLAQDPIDIMEDTVDGYIAVNEVGGSVRPGRANEIRDDVVDMTYKLLADIDPQRPGDEEVVKITYTVNSLSSPGDSVNEIYKASDNKLRFKVGSNQLTTTCDHTKPPSSGGCVGCGMPIQLYGTVVGNILAFETDTSTGVPVTLVKLREVPAPDRVQKSLPGGRAE